MLGQFIKRGRRRSETAEESRRIYVSLLIGINLMHLTAQHILLIHASSAPQNKKQFR